MRTRPLARKIPVLYYGTNSHNIPYIYINNARNILLYIPRFITYIHIYIYTTFARLPLAEYPFDTTHCVICYYS